MGGMRVTDEETVEIVEMVLVGKINKEIVGLINHHGGRAVGLSRQGRRPDPRAQAAAPDCRAARRSTSAWSARWRRVNVEPIRLLEERGFVPVIAPVGVGERGETYNINADLVAGEVAAALGAEKLIHLTDVQGIKGTDGQLISTLSRKEAERLMQAGVIDGGMLPKVESSLRALEGAPPRPTSSTAGVPHAILLELFTREGVGTEIVLYGGHHGHQDTDGVVGEVPHAQLRPDAAGAGARRGHARVGQRRPRVPRLHLGHRGHLARPLPSGRHRRHPRGGGHAAARLQHLPQRAPGPPRQAAGRALVRRPRVLLQLGSGGQRGRPQGRAQVRQGAAVHRPLRGHRHPQLVPRPHAGHRDARPASRSTSTASSRSCPASSTCRTTTCARWSARWTATPRPSWWSRSRARAACTSRTTATCRACASSATSPARC